MKPAGSDILAQSHDERPLERVLDEISRALRALSPEVESYGARAQNPQLSWSSRDLKGKFCVVRGRNGLLDPDHPFVDVLSIHGGSAPLFAASVVATEVNRRSRRVSDSHDFRLQRALLLETTDE